MHSTRMTVPLLLFAAVTSAQAQQRAKSSTAAQLRAAMKRGDAAIAATTPSKTVLAGRILLSDGSPAAGARLFVATVAGSEPVPVHVDAEGRFRREVDPAGGRTAPGIVISALLPSKGFAWRLIDPADPTLGHLVLTLERTTSLTGHVVDLAGKPVAGALLAVKGLIPGFHITGAQQPADMAREAEFGMMQFMPKDAQAQLYRARTDASGRFTIEGLPSHGLATLKALEGRILAPGSAAPITLAGIHSCNAGIVVAERPASLTVHVTDAATGKPAAGLAIRTLPETLDLATLGAIGGDDEVGSRFSGAPTDSHGDVHVGALRPAHYRVVVAGAVRTVDLRAGGSASVSVAVRTGPLRGRVLDAAGKPAANVPVSVTAPNLFESVPFAMGMTASNGQADATTDASGRFELSEFPWGADPVTLRATHGNDQAVWTGAASRIGQSLLLRIQPHALVTVTGRFVAPDHKTVPAGDATVIRWQDSVPRISWFFNARQTKIAAGGRFRIDGLQRGEAFSVLSGVGLAALGGSDDTGGFESPRFVAAASPEVAVQDLGEVVVHPLDSAGQALQIYGIGSRAQLAELTALTGPPPDAHAADEAKAALARYRDAVNAGDVDTALGLCSSASGPAADRASLLGTLTLRSEPGAGDAANLASARPLRFVANISLAYSLAFGRGNAATFGFDFGGAVRQLEQNPDWIVLAVERSDKPEALPRPQRGTGLTVAGVLRRENGAWRVVQFPFSFGNSLDDIFVNLPRQAPPPAAAGFRTPAPALDTARIDAARRVGEQYLAAWAHDDDPALVALTSPIAAISASNVQVFRRRLAQRADEGVCPAGDAPNLQPLTGLTAWEAAWLADYAASANEFTGSVRPPASGAAAEGFPDAYVQRRDIAIFRYAAGERDYLMVLLRHGEKWQVLEPALQLSGRPAGRTASR